MADGNRFEAAAEVFRRQQEAQEASEAQEARKREASHRHSARVVAQKNAARAEKEQLAKDLYQAKALKDANHQGTWPAQIWGDDAAQLCLEFLDFASSRNHASAQKLSHRRRFLNKWSIKGYGVGGVIFDTDSKDVEDITARNLRKEIEKPTRVTRLAIGTNLAHNVFLCEDGQLRLYTSEEAPGLEKKFDSSRYDHLYKRSPPHIIADLPLDIERYYDLTPIDVQVGSFVTSTVVYERWRPIPGGNGGNSLPDNNISYFPVDFVRFSPSDLETELFNRVQEIEAVQ